MFFKKIKNAETNANFASGCNTKSDEGCCLAAIDYTADFENLFGRFDAYTKFCNTGKTKNDLVRYIPGLTKPVHQGKIDGTLTKKAYADDTYKGLKVAEFNIKLTNNQYMNFHNVYLVFLMKT